MQLNDWPPVLGIFNTRMLYKTALNEDLGRKKACRTKTGSNLHDEQHTRPDTQPMNFSSNKWAPSLPQVSSRPILQASLSGTFLQTLPELVTSLKRHSLSLRICPLTLSAPSKRYQDCENKTVSKQARGMSTLATKMVQSGFTRFPFYLRWCKQCRHS